MDDKTYNGWTNYETWNVALWLGNEEGSESDMRDLTRSAHDEPTLARQIKDYVEELQPDLGASMFADLLGGALSEVNWYEIAEHYWADYRDEDEAEDDSDADSDDATHSG